MSKTKIFNLFTTDLVPGFAGALHYGPKFIGTITLPASTSEADALYKARNYYINCGLVPPNAAVEAA